MILCYERSVNRKSYKKNCASLWWNKWLLSAYLSSAYKSDHCLMGIYGLVLKKLQLSYCVLLLCVCVLTGCIYVTSVKGKIPFWDNKGETNKQSPKAQSSYISAYEPVHHLPSHHFRHVVQRSSLHLVQLALDSRDSLQLFLSIAVAWDSPLSLQRLLNTRTHTHTRQK